MEKGLVERDRVGLQDQVLLEDYTNENAFIDNLKKRFQENFIYVSCMKFNKFIDWFHPFVCFQTYIGQVLISVNPYKELPIYTENDEKEYRKRHFFEAPPHV